METAVAKKGETAIAGDFDRLIDAMFTAFIVAGSVVILLPTLVRIAERSSGLVQNQMLFTQSQMYTGNVDQRWLYADGNTKWLNLVENSPYTPWVAADFYNYGPDKAYIGINTPGPWSELQNGEGLQTNMIGAARRIEAIFYKCDSDKKATVKVEGKY